MKIKPLAVSLPSAPTPVAPIAAPASQPRTKKEKVTFAQLTLLRLNRDRRNFKKLFDKIGKWNPVILSLGESICRDLNKVEHEVELAIKAGKTNQRPGPQGLQPGASVRIQEKLQAQYSDILALEDGNSVLTVVRVSGSRVLCKAASGICVVLPRGHLLLEKGDA